MNDVNLLSTIADAYYRLNTTIFLESKYVDVAFFPGLTVQPNPKPEGWKSLREQVVDALLSTDDDTINSARAALATIEKEKNQAGK